MTPQIALLTEIRDLLKARQPAKEIMNHAECADYLGCGKTFVYNLRAEYKIPFSKVLGRIFFVKKNIDRWLEDCTVLSAANEVRINKEQSKEPIRIAEAR